MRPASEEMPGLPASFAVRAWNVVELFTGQPREATLTKGGLDKLLFSAQHDFGG